MFFGIRVIAVSAFVLNKSIAISKSIERLEHSILGSVLSMFNNMSHEISILSSVIIAWGLNIP